MKSANFVARPKRIQVYLDELDKMNLAKHFPGKYNIRYINGLTPSSAMTGILDASFSMSQCYAQDATTQMIVS